MKKKSIQLEEISNLKTMSEKNMDYLKEFDLFEKGSHTHIKPYREPKQPDFYELVSGVSLKQVDHEIWLKYLNTTEEVNMVYI